MTRRAAVLLALASAAFAGSKKQPEEILASFPGVVRGLSAKSLTLQDPEGNTVEFDCSGKTRYYEGAKRVRRDAVRPGDRVIVEARRTLVGRLEAVNVRRK